MRPSPLILLAFVAVGFALIALPLSRLTGATEASRPAPTPASTANTTLIPTLVRIRFAHPPLRIKISQNTRPLAVLAAPPDPASGQIETQTTLDLGPDESADLLVEADWPEDTPTTALGLEVEPDGFETRRATAWTASPSTTELIHFSWK